MQGLPSQRTLDHFITKKQERYPQSQTMDHHNKATGFERRLGAYILENFRLTKFDLETYRRESQRMQADALGYAYRGWRRLWRDKVTSGALVWQAILPRH
jgi:beta-mannosidase